MNYSSLTRVRACSLFWFVLPAALSYGAVLSVTTSARDITVVPTGRISLQRGQDAAVHINADGSFFNSQAGQPDIPWQLVTVLLPPQADLDSITLRLDAAEYDALEGIWEIEPAPPMATRDEEGNETLLWPIGRIIEDGRDAAIYNTDAFWPVEKAQVVHAGRLSQWQLVELAVPLVQYNPVKGRLKELISADVIVDFARIGSGKANAPGQNGTALSSGRGRSRVRGMAVNFAAVAEEYDSVLSGEPLTGMQSSLAEEGPVGTAGLSSSGYVILTTSNIAANSTQLADFAAHKQSLGWNVSIVTEDQWGGGLGSTGAVNIRNWLRANYITNDILYVLLIGNPHPETGDVPMRWYNDGYETGGVYGAPTDALYSDLSAGDAWDKYWEVIVGRIPYYGSMSALDAILQKTINYENSQQVLWRWNALLPMVPLSDTTPSYQCGEQIKDQLLTPNGILATRIYHSTYSLNPPPEYLLSNRYPALEWSSQPYGLVAWITHGWATGASEVITTSNVNQLNNTYPSAVYQGSCQNAWPENTGNLAYRILQNGGITTVAATRNSYYTPGQTNYTTGFSIGTLAYHYTKNMAANRQSCGAALAQAKASLNLYKANATRMVMYGDPSIVVFVDPDFTPPTPDPMTWEVTPHEISPGVVSMTATTAVDNNQTGVQYYFQCVSGGGRSSGWQSSRVYTDSGVTQLYNVYRVKARDLSDSMNETAYSSSASVTLSAYPYGVQARAIPGKIQAEHFDVGGQGVTYYDTTAGNSGGQLRTREDVDIVAITDGTAGYAIDNIATGEWLLFTVNSTAGSTDLYARVASVQDNGQISISLNGQILGTFDVPNTGSLSVWQNVMLEGITLPDAENAQLKIQFSGTGYRFNWIAFENQMPYHGYPFSIGGRIEFEDFDFGGQDIAYYDTTPLGNSYGKYRTDEGVDIMSITDGGASGFAVFADAPEWLEYSCTIQPGFYTIVVRHTSTSFYTNQLLSLSIEGQTLATFALPATGGWSNWQDYVVPDVYLDGGEDVVLRFTMESSSALLNHVEFIRHYIPGDITRSGCVDIGDFSVMASQWQGIPAELSADIAPAGGDEWVNELDLLILAENWLSCE